MQGSGDGTLALGGPLVQQKCAGDSRLPCKHIGRGSGSGARLAHGHGTWPVRDMLAGWLAGWPQELFLTRDELLSMEPVERLLRGEPQPPAGTPAASRAGGEHLCPRRAACAGRAALP